MLLFFSSQYNIMQNIHIQYKFHVAISHCYIARGPRLGAKPSFFWCVCDILILYLEFLYNWTKFNVCITLMVVIYTTPDLYTILTKASQELRMSDCCVLSLLQSLNVRLSLLFRYSCCYYYVQHIEWTFTKESICEW